MNSSAACFSLDGIFANKKSTEVTGRFIEIVIVNDDQTEDVVFTTPCRSTADEAVRRLIRSGQTAIIRGVK